MDLSGNASLVRLRVQSTHKFSLIQHKIHHSSTENHPFPLKNDDLLLKNVDFLLKNVDFLLKNVDFRTR